MVQRETEEIRRQQILEAARRCIARQGYHQTTMNDIASEAELSKGALYWYFKSKDDVLVALCKHSCNQHLEVLKQFTEQNKTIRELALKTGDKILDLLINESDHRRVTFELWALADENRQIKKALGEELKIWQDTVSNLINSGIERGEINHNINLNELSIVLLALFDGIVVKYTFDNTLDVKKIWHAAISAIFDGIAR